MPSYCILTEDRPAKTFHYRSASHLQCLAGHTADRELFAELFSQSVGHKGVMRCSYKVSYHIGINNTHRQALHLQEKQSLPFEAPAQTVHCCLIHLKDHCESCPQSMSL